jgi:branched-chain amino acid transport system permease protein
VGLYDTVSQYTDYWRATLGAIILLLVLLFPQGIAGYAAWLVERLKWRFVGKPA